MAKLLISLGLVFILLGLAIKFDLYKHFPLGKLPGDLHLKKEGFSIYFPITSCLVASVFFYLISKIN